MKKNNILKEFNSLALNIMIDKRNKICPPHIEFKTKFDKHKNSLYPGFLPQKLVELISAGLILRELISAGLILPVRQSNGFSYSVVSVREQMIKRGDVPKPLTNYDRLKIYTMIRHALIKFCNWLGY